MKLSMGTKSIIKNSLVILSTSGHHIFEWSLHQLTTCYFTSIMMKLTLTYIKPKSLGLGLSLTLTYVKPKSLG